MLKHAYLGLWYCTVPSGILGEIISIFNIVLNHNLVL